MSFELCIMCQVFDRNALMHKNVDENCIDRFSLLKLTNIYTSKCVSFYVQSQTAQIGLESFV